MLIKKKPLESRFPPARPRFGFGMTAADFEDSPSLGGSSRNTGQPLTETSSPRERKVRQKSSQVAKTHVNSTPFGYTLPTNGSDTDRHNLTSMSSSSVSSFGSSLATDRLVAQHVEQNGTIFFGTSSDQSDHQQIYEDTPPSSVFSFDLKLTSNASSSARTLTPPLSQNIADHTRPVFALFSELQFLRSLALRLFLDYTIRQDEGSFIFKHQRSSRMIVLTRSEALGGEEIRVSQHQDGRIFRESYIQASMENWMVRSLLRGLCEDFFQE